MTIFTLNGDALILKIGTREPKLLVNFQNGTSYSVTDSNLNTWMCRLVWHYVVITRNGSRLSLWIDGTERFFTDDGLGTINPDNGPLVIGMGNILDDNYLGWIDDFGVLKNASIDGSSIPTQPIG